MNRKLYPGIGSVLLLGVLWVLAFGAGGKSGSEETPSVSGPAQFSVSTLPPTNIGTISVTLNGQIAGGKATRWGFVYGTKPMQDPGNVSPEKAGYQFMVMSEVGEYTGRFHADITGLAPGTRYYFRATALRGINWVYGGQIH